MKAAHIVVGLGNGDEGKGTVVDALVRQTHVGPLTMRAAQARLVVRFNGGPQAAHHVVCDDGRWHGFHQFGAGTFAGARTHLSRFVLVDPFALHREAKQLLSIGVAHPWGRITADSRCLVTTPYQQAMNRIRELARGDNRHGSCGMGVGETVDDNINGRPVVQLGVTTESTSLWDTLEAIRREKLAEATTLGVVGPYYDLLRDEKSSKQFASSYQFIAGLLAMRDDADMLDTAEGTVVFEGAQGALLDQDLGFAPYTTWSKTSAENALALIANLGRPVPTTVTGVVRSYATRHGAGPLPTEMTPLALLDGDHNAMNEWQGRMRVGAFDLAMLQYALTVNNDKVTQLAVTHMDKVTDKWPVAVAYRYATHEGATLTDTVAAARPDYIRVPLVGFLKTVRERLGLPILLTSWGPTAAEKIYIQPQETATC